MSEGKTTARWPMLDASAEQNVSVEVDAGTVIGEVQRETSEPIVTIEEDTLSPLVMEEFDAESKTVRDALRGARLLSAKLVQMALGAIVDERAPSIELVHMVWELVDAAEKAQRIVETLPKVAR